MYHNLGSKLDRAIRAYLINAGACTTDDIFTANSSAVKPLPCIIVNSHTGQPDPLNIGNYLVDVRIEIKFGAALEEGQTNIEAERKQADELVASVFDALMQSDDSQSLKATGDKIQAAGRNLAAADETKADNSDMEQFSVFNWYEAGFERGAPDEEGCYWLEVLNFRASCCPSKVD